MAPDPISITESSAKEFSPIIIYTEKSSFNIGVTLHETNYNTWSQLMEMHITEKQKFSFIHGTTFIPKERTPKYEAWYLNNQRVKRWLLMSMKPEIMKRYIRVPTAREICHSLSKAFDDGTNKLYVFTFNQRVFTTKQSGKPLSKYYGERERSSANWIIAIRWSWKVQMI